MKLFITSAVTIGIIIGATVFTPGAMKASTTELVLASVDWVNSKINPINNKIAALEAKINNQQKEINSLKAKLNGETPTEPAPEPDELPQVVFVSDNYATVHSGATPNYKIVATYSKGTPLLVIDKFSSSAGLWYRVSLSPTLKGWINSDNVSNNQIAPTTDLKIVTVNSTLMRRGASTSYAVTETIPKGVTLKYIQTFINNSTNEIWFNVESNSGKKGWIPAENGQVK